MPQITRECLANVTGQFLQHMLSFLRKAHDFYLLPRVPLWRNPSKCNNLKFPFKKFVLYPDIFQRIAEALPEVPNIYFYNSFQGRFFISLWKQSSQTLLILILTFLKNSYHTDITYWFKVNVGHNGLLAFLCIRAYATPFTHSR